MLSHVVDLLAADIGPDAKLLTLIHLGREMVRPRLRRTGRRRSTGARRTPTVISSVRRTFALPARKGKTRRRDDDATRFKLRCAICRSPGGSNGSSGVRGGGGSADDTTSAIKHSCPPFTQVGVHPPSREHPQLAPVKVHEARADEDRGVPRDGRGRICPREANGCVSDSICTSIVYARPHVRRFTRARNALRTRRISTGYHPNVR